MRETTLSLGASVQLWIRPCLTVMRRWVPSVASIMLVLISTSRNSAQLLVKSTEIEVMPSTLKPPVIVIPVSPGFRGGTVTVSALGGFGCWTACTSEILRKGA